MFYLFWFTYRVTADGNCLYNVGSLMVTGNENSSHLLQTLCSAELYPYPDCYASPPPFIALLAKERTSGPLETIFSQVMTFQASDHFDKSLQNYADCVKLEALFNAQNRILTPFTYLMAQESDLGLPIHSIYPETGNRHAVSLGNTLIHPREMKCVNCILLNLMWSVCAKGKKALYQPDHIAPVFIINDENQIHSV